MFLLAILHDRYISNITQRNEPKPSNHLGGLPPRNPSQSVQSRVPACDPLNHHVTPEPTSTTTHSTPQPSNADFKQLCMFDFIFLRPRLLFSRILVQYSSNRVILWKTCCPALLLFSSPCLSTLIEPSCPVTMEVETSCAQCSSTRMIF